MKNSYKRNSRVRKYFAKVPSKNIKLRTEIREARKLFKKEEITTKNDTVLSDSIQ